MSKTVKMINFEKLMNERQILSQLSELYFMIEPYVMEIPYDEGAYEKSRRALDEQKGIGQARKLLQKRDRGITRRDLLEAMDHAVRHCFAAWEQKQGAENAVTLIATVICRNMLKDGPLHEEE